MKRLRIFFGVTDVGFLLYWLLTLSHMIPVSVAFKDYADPIVSAWNWSFFPLDMCISLTGIATMVLFSQKNEAWRRLALLSLALTFCAGLQAVSFWFLRGDFDWMWWGLNLYLMIYPLFFVKELVRQ